MSRRVLAALVALLLMSLVSGRAVSTSTEIDISVTNAASAQTPGPSAALYAGHPYYTCSTNYYVSTSGNSTNNGTSPGTPWDIVTASGKTTGPGSCVNIAPGLYTISDSVGPANGGNLASTTGYVVWRCTTMPFGFNSSGVLQGEGSANSCHIKNSGSNFFVFGINLNTSFVMVDGLELDGSGILSDCLDISAANNTPAQAGKQDHIWIMNSDLHGCGQSGIQVLAQDWFFAIHNVWHDNSNVANMGSGYSDFVPVGVSGYTPTTQDQLFHSNTTGLQYHKVILYNVGYHNFNGYSGATDGEGIILDTYGHNQSPYGCASYPGAVCPYTFPTLVMGNVMYYNGGNGIEAFSWDLPAGGFATAPVTIVNNTMYDNNWDTAITGTFRGGGLANAAVHGTWINNIAIAVAGTPTCNSSGISCPFVGETTATSNNLWQTNFSYPGDDNLFDGTFNTYPTTGTNHNTDGINPNLTSVTPNSTSNNFQPLSGSAVIGAGQAFDLWQQSGTVDAGACVFSSPGPLTHCP